MGHKLCGCIRLATLSPGTLGEWSWRLQRRYYQSWIRFFQRLLFQRLRSTWTDIRRAIQRQLEMEARARDLGRASGSPASGSRDHTKVPGRRAARVPRAGRTAAEGRHADMPLTFARLPLRHFGSITLRRFMTTQELLQQEKLMRLSERCAAEIHRTKNEDIRSTLTMALTAINEAWFHLETQTESRVPQS